LLLFISQVMQHLENINEVAKGIAVRVCRDHLWGRIGQDPVFALRQEA
jgi:hypothetical protein